MRRRGTRRGPLVLQGATRVYSGVYGERDGGAQARRRVIPFYRGEQLRSRN